MSDSRRRLVCRVLFVLLCVVPTAGAVHFWYHQPGTAVWEQTIKAQVGLVVRVDSIETPEPGRVILRGVQVLDPEIRLESRIVQIEIHTWGTPKRIRIKQPVGMAGNSLLALSKRLIDSWSAPTGIGSDWRIEFDQVTLYHGELDSVLEPLVMNRMLCDFNIRQNERAATLRFKLPESETASELIASRRQRGSVWESRWELQTQEAALPTWLVGQFLPEMKSLGRNSQFTGTVSLRETPQGIGGAFEGNLRGIDLESLGRDLDFPIQGLADARVRADLQRGQVQRLECSLVARNGVADRLWLEDFTRIVQAGHGFEPSQKLVPFANAWLSFVVQGGQIYFDSDYLQIASLDNNRALIAAAERPIAGLEETVKTLAGHTQPSEQVTNHVVSLLNRFDLPPITQTARENQSNLR